MRSGDDEERFNALCEQAFDEKDSEKLTQLISAIFALLEANEKRLRERGAAASDDKA